MDETWVHFINHRQNSNQLMIYRRTHQKIKENHYETLYSTTNHKT